MTCGGWQTKCLWLPNTTGGIEAEIVNMGVGDTLSLWTRQLLVVRDSGRFALLLPGLEWIGIAVSEGQ